MAGGTFKATATAKKGFDIEQWIFDGSYFTKSQAYSGKSSIATFTVKSNIQNTFIGKDIYVSTDTSVPSISSYSATNAADNSYVELSFELNCEAGLGAYAITTTQGIPSSGSDTWKSLNNETNKTITYQATAAGTYYVYVKSADGTKTRGYSILKDTTVDDEGNVTYNYVEKGINVYSVTLNPGEGAIGSAITLFKAESTSFNLPNNTYTKTGYGFLNWKGTDSQTYANGSAYAANKSDTLTAQWTKAIKKYKVNYYLMDTDGSYGSTAYQTQEFETEYNTTINYNDSNIQISLEGFTLDTSKQSSVVIDDDNKSINVYYKRNQYHLKTEVTNTDGTITHAEYLTYYGKDLGTLLNNKPSLEGYTFVGWDFSEIGYEPTTMPAHDITIKGSFTPNSAKYHISYFFEKIGTDSTNTETYNKRLKTYSYNSNYSSEVTVVQDTEINFDSTSANEIDGYEYKGVIVTNGSMFNYLEELDDSKVETSISGVKAQSVTSKEVYINVFYTRKEYTVTLNIWKGTVGDNKIYTKDWKFLYGAALDSNALSNYGNDDWTKNAGDMDGYALANYIDYSTGQYTGETGPTTMPAGDVTITRQYVKQTAANFTVEVWLESDTDNTYEKNKSLTYFDYIGTNVSINQTTGSITRSAGTEIDNYSGDIYGFSEYYEYANIESLEGITATGAAGGQVLTGEINKDGTLVLRVFYKRKTRTVTIRYQAISRDSNGVLQGAETIAVVTKTRKWGTSDIDYFDVEPLAYFDDEAYTWKEDHNVTTAFNFNGSSAAYDFRGNNYVVSFGYNYRILEVENYERKQLNTVASLGTTYSYPTGSDENGSWNVVTVTYMQMDGRDFDDLKYVDIIHNFSSFNTSAKNEIYSGTTTFADLNGQPVTYTFNDKEYKIRLASEAYFYTDSTFVPGSNSEYPGLAYLNNSSDSDGHWTHGDTLRANFSKKDISGKTYYLYDDPSGTNNYIYICDTSNKLYEGSSFSYSFTSDPLYTATITNDVLAKYQSYSGNHPLAAGAYIHSADTAGQQSNVVTNGNLTLSVVYRDGKGVYLYHVINNVTCGGHPYANGTTVSGTGLSTCNKFPTMSGYDINWYSDSTYSTKISSYTMNDSHAQYVYGKYEKQSIELTEYVYYELPDDVTINGVSYSTLTETEIEAIQNDSTLKDKLKVTTPTSGKTVYTYNNNLAMIKTIKTELCFSDVSIDLANYNKDGFVYDESNKNNNTISYVEDKSISLKAYYVRNKHNLVIDPNSDESSISTYEERLGQTVTIFPLSRDGYTFNGWIAYKIVDSEYVVDESITFTSLGDNKYSIIQPDYDLTIKAQWEPTTFNTTIIHYYQNSSGKFDVDKVGILVEALKDNTASIEQKNVLVDEESRGVDLIKKDDAVIAVRYNNYYYTDFDENTYAINSGNVSAYIELSKTVKQDDVITIGTDNIVVKDADGNETTYDLNTLLYVPTNFTYSYTQYELNGTSKYNVNEAYTNKYGMQLSRFYTRVAGSISLSPAVESYPLTSISPVITGRGSSYIYGQKVTINTTDVDGYTFKGWYKSDDFNTITSTLNDGATAVSSSANTTVTAGISDSYIALYSAKQIGTPTITLSGITTLNYGYTEDPTYCITATTTFENDDGKNIITNYEWYKNGTKIDDAANSSTLLIHRGWTTGDYAITCKITVVRSDNNLTGTFTSSTAHELKVNASTFITTVKNINCEYDGTDKYIGVTVRDEFGNSLTNGTDYEIYYSETELTKDNYTSGSETNIGKKNVKKVNGAVTAHTIYYYVHSLNPNYNDASASGTITINPKQLTLSIGTDVYSKTYDGDAEVNGTATDSSTDLGKLAAGFKNGKNYFTITGLVDGEADALLLNCDAEFDVKHTSAKVLTLSNISMVSTSGVINDNYTFGDGYSFAMSGFINKKHLELNWHADKYDKITLTYNAQEQAPSPTISTTDIPECDSSYISLEVLGGQTYAGTYSASANLVIKAGATDTDKNDYAIENSTHDFTISPRSIVLTPKDITSVYDKKDMDTHLKILK